MATEVEPHSTIFMISGDELRDALEKRAARHQGEINECLDQVSRVLREKAGDSYDNLLSVAINAMMAQYSPEGTMTAPTRVIQSQLARAAHLQNERIDLLTISRNISSNHKYRLTVEEARRYGMT